MFKPFNQISNNSRVWIYQSDRMFTSQEKSIIEKYLFDLCQNWNTHGKPVESSFLVKDWFICLFVNESFNNASGCSIDSSVSTIKKIEKQFKLDLFNRLNIAYIDNHDNTKVVSLSEFKNVVTKDMKVFNNLVQTKYDLEKNWIIPIEKSWLFKYLN